MFRIENNVPEVYVNESRDFQLVSRLYDLAINTTKQSISTLEDLSSSKYCNSSILPLLCTKIGIFDNLQMSDKEYRVLLSVFPYLVRKKGSKEAIDILCNAFSHIVNTYCKCIIPHPSQPEIFNALISFEDYSPDLNLLLTLLEYVRPAGYKIDVQIATSIDLGDPSSAADNFGSKDSYSVQELDSSINQVYPQSGSTKLGQSKVGFVTVLNNTSTETEQ